MLAISRRPSFRFVATALAVATLSASLLAQTSTGFLRMDKPTATKEVLQTKARLYKPAKGDGPAIWLVGVAHIGRASYYQDLQKLLDQQELVLYEAVNRKGVDPTKLDTQKQSNSIYKAFSDTLGLDFQLAKIDYKKPSFRRSDLSWEEMEELEKKQPKGTGMNLASLGGMLDPESPTGKSLVSLMAMIKEDPGACEGLRVGMIEALSNPAAIDQALSPTLGSLIIHARNDRVMADLKAEVAKPGAAKTIAVFYGAGHMADLEKKLTTDMGYVGGEEKWFSAMEGDTSKVTGQGTMILNALRAQFNKKGGK